jgi:hypothetical protein
VELPSLLQGSALVLLLARGALILLLILIVTDFDISPVRLHLNSEMVILWMFELVIYEKSACLINLLFSGMLIHDILCRLSWFLLVLGFFLFQVMFCAIQFSALIVWIKMSSG